MKSAHLKVLNYLLTVVQVDIQRIATNTFGGGRIKVDVMNRHLSRLFPICSMVIKSVAKLVMLNIC